MSDEPASIPRSVGLLVAAALAAAGTVLGAIRAPRVISEFHGLFQGFGADLSAGTRLVLNSPYIWWVFAIASLILFVWVAAKSQLAPTEGRRMKLALRVLISLTALAYGFAIYWLYLPIFKLGAAI
jgi:hypothetical protein